ncbi:MAG: hypothetical protein OEY67_07085 [Gammaproteobacteria bacterium]|nr:hypothetical protein [Gammaproteobacteria bacterium]
MSRNSREQQDSPFRVLSSDRFDWPSDDHEVGQFDDLEQAIACAREINTNSRDKMNDEKAWRSMGTHGLVYSAKGSLVWSQSMEDEKSNEEPKPPPLRWWQRILRR